MMRTFTSREIALAAIAVLVASVALLWGIVIAPTITSRENSLAQLRKADIIWAVLSQLPDSLESAQTVVQQPLRQRVAVSARAASIEIRRLDPQGSAVSVSLDDVAFAALIGWLDTLTTKLAVQVFSAEIARRPEPGIVSARIVMEDAR